MFTCDGRSEDALDTQAYVIPVWDGWMASNHVMRVEPEEHIGHGFLYLALTSRWTQIQIKATACGSVVDALVPEELDRIVIPMLPNDQRKDVDERVRACWNKVSESIEISRSAVEDLEAVIAGERVLEAVKPAAAYRSHHPGAFS